MPPVGSVLGNCVVGRGGIKASPSALVRGAQDATGWGSINANRIYSIRNKCGNILLSHFFMVWRTEDEHQ